MITIHIQQLSQSSGNVIKYELIQYTHFIWPFSFSEIAACVDDVQECDAIAAGLCENAGQYFIINFTCSHFFILNRIKSLSKIFN